MSVPVQPGDVIDGVYVIERLLGKGGMGAVFVAREERLARRVAIKVLLEAVKDNPGAVMRFEREARSAAALQSDHVTRVLSVGHLPGGTPYIVMELLEGEDLAALLAKRGRLAVDEVVSYMAQVCEALTEAHELGIVHRDLKPANIFLARRPTGATTVKVLDFGISKGATGSAPQSLTATSAVIGTPFYMSPEQVRESKSVDARADVWALGVVMYELLTGRPPFVADTLADLCVLISNTNPPPLSAHRPEVTPALDAILKRCLEKEPAHRFTTVKELMVALSLATSAAAPAAAPRAPVVMPRSRTAPLNPQSMPTQGLDEARARTQLQTAAMPQTPPLPPPSDPRMATVPLDRSSEPRGGTVPLGRSSEPRQLHVHARTVDPVSNTQTWLPPKPPRILGLIGVFAAALAVGGVTLYTLILRRPADPAGDPAVASSGATDAAQALASTSAAAPIASASVQPPTTFLTAPGTASVKPPGGTVLLPPSSTATTTIAAPQHTGAAVLPPPTATLAPPLAAPPVTAPPPSTRPAKPPTEPGSLMPGARN